MKVVLDEFHRVPKSPILPSKCLTMKIIPTVCIVYGWTTTVSSYDKGSDSSTEKEEEGCDIGTIGAIGEGGGEETEVEE